MTQNQFLKIYTALKAQKVMFKKDAGHLLSIENLKDTNDFKWVAPSFSQSKPKQLGTISEIF